MNLRCKRIIKIASLIFFVTAVLSCKTEIKDETPLVMVNNEAITFAQFRKALGGIHLQYREEGKGEPLDIKNFLDKLISDRLFIQEAVRTGLDQAPEVVLTVKAELKRQSILYLHKEEIDDKVRVTDDEAWEEYCARLEKRRTKVRKIREEYSADPNEQSTEMKNYLSMLRKRAKLEVDPNYIQPGEGQYDPNKIAATNIVVRLPSRIEGQALLKPSSKEMEKLFCWFNSSFIREKIRILASIAIPIDKIKPPIPAKVKVIGINLKKHPTTLAFHLNKLVELDLIERIRVGNKIRYKLKNPEIIYDLLISYDRRLFGKAVHDVIYWMEHPDTSTVLVDRIAGAMFEILPHPYHV